MVVCVFFLGYVCLLSIVILFVFRRVLSDYTLFLGVYLVIITPARPKRDSIS